MWSCSLFGIPGVQGDQYCLFALPTPFIKAAIPLIRHRLAVGEGRGKVTFISMFPCCLFIPWMIMKLDYTDKGCRCKWCLVVRPISAMRNLLLFKLSTWENIHETYMVEFATLKLPSTAPAPHKITGESRGYDFHCEANQLWATPLCKLGPPVALSTLSQCWAVVQRSPINLLGWIHLP